MHINIKSKHRFKKASLFFFEVVFMFFFKPVQTNKIKRIFLQRRKGNWMLNPGIRRLWKSLASLRGRTAKNNAKTRTSEMFYSSRKLSKPTRRLRV